MRADRLIQPVKTRKAIMLPSQNQQVNKIPSFSPRCNRLKGKKTEKCCFLTVVSKVSWFCTGVGGNIKLGCSIHTSIQQCGLWSSRARRDFWKKKKGILTARLEIRQKSHTILEIASEPSQAVTNKRLIKLQTQESEGTFSFISPHTRSNETEFTLACQRDTHEFQVHQPQQLYLLITTNSQKGRGVQFHTEGKKQAEGITGTKNKCLYNIAW